MIRTFISNRWYRVALTPEGVPEYKTSLVEPFPPQLAPEDVSEANLPPGKFGTYTFRDLSGGFGQVETPVLGPNRSYDHIGDVAGEGIDCTLTPRGPIILGPGIVGQAIDAAESSPKIHGLLWRGGTTLAYFLGGGGLAYSWDGITATNVGTLAANPTDALTAFRGSSTAETWYGPLGYATTPKYSTDSGVTWTAVGTGGGFDLVQSLAVVDGQLFAARASQYGQGNAMVCRVDDGGSAPTIFGVIDPVGDSAVAITRIMEFHGRVLILKAGEGIFVLAGDRHTLAENILPLYNPPVALDTTRSPNRGVGATVWRGLLWIPTAQGLLAMGPRFRVQHVGPAHFASQSLGSASVGTVIAVAGDDYNLYALSYVTATSGTYRGLLLKAIVKIGAGFAGPFVEEISWHPILVASDSASAIAQKPYALFYASPGGNGPKLLICPATGSSIYAPTLPSNGEDPRADVNYRYATGGTLYMSRLTARFPALLKSFMRITPLARDLGRTVDGSTATAAQSLADWYKADTTALTTTSPFGYTAAPAQTSGVGADDAISVRARGLDVAVRLVTSAAATTPQLQAVTVGYVLQPSPVWQHEIVVELSPAGLSGSPEAGVDAVSPEVGLEALRILPSAASFTFIDPINPNVTRTVVCPPNGVEPTIVGPPSGATGEQIPLRVKVLMVETSPPAAWV